MKNKSKDFIELTFLYKIQIIFLIRYILTFNLSNFCNPYKYKKAITYILVRSAKRTDSSYRVAALLLITLVFAE